MTKHGSKVAREENLWYKVVPAWHRVRTTWKEWFGSDLLANTDSRMGQKENHLQRVVLGWLRREPLTKSGSRVAQGKNHCQAVVLK